MLFIIVPAKRRLECYGSIYDTNGFHYESLNYILKFIKDYQVSNKLPIDDWTWSVKIVSEPQKNNNSDYGVLVCMIIYYMTKGWDFNSIPVEAYNSRLRFFVASLMLKWEVGYQD
jgi:Ulp1 family protease